MIPPKFYSSIVGQFGGVIRFDVPLLKTVAVPWAYDPLSSLIAASARSSDYFTLLVRRLRKSISTNCVRLFGFAKYALPRVIAVICLTNSTRYGSLASMNVLIMMPDLRHAWTSLNVS